MDVLGQIEEQAEPSCGEAYLVAWRNGRETNPPHSYHSISASNRSNWIDIYFPGVSSDYEMILSAIRANQLLQVGVNLGQCPLTLSYSIVQYSTVNSGETMIEQSAHEFGEEQSCMCNNLTMTKSSIIHFIQDISDKLEVA